jgi:hypothetical protein
MPVPQHQVDEGQLLDVASVGLALPTCPEYAVVHRPTSRSSTQGDHGDHY